MTFAFGDPRLPDRFWSKISSDTSDCWEFTGWRDNGYGRFKMDGIDVRAHRLTWETFVGFIPEGFVIDHLCRNRACCNPTHLEPVTHRVNILRGEGLAAQAARKTHCAQGHELSGGNLAPNAKNRRICLECRKAFRRPARVEA